MSEMVNMVYVQSQRVCRGNVGTVKDCGNYHNCRGEAAFLKESAADRSRKKSVLKRFCYALWPLRDVAFTIFGDFSCKLGHDFLS